MDGGDDAVTCTIIHYPEEDIRSHLRMLLLQTKALGRACVNNLPLVVRFIFLASHSWWLALWLFEPHCCFVVACPTSMFENPTYWL